VLRKEVSGQESARAALFIHLKGRHEVEPEEDQVHEIVLVERLAPKVGVDATKAAETAALPAAGGKFRNEDRTVIAHDNVVDVPAPGDEETDLPVHLEGEASKVPGEVGRDDALGRYGPSVESFQSSEVTSPETGGMTVNPSDR
jgi:hypothetical protein